MTEQVFFNVPLSRLEPIFKNWLKDVLKESNQQKPVTKKQTDKLLTVGEVAALMHLSKATIYTNYSRGFLPGGCKRGKRLYFQEKILIDWIKTGRKKTNEEIDSEAEAYLKQKGGSND